MLSALYNDVFTYSMRHDFTYVFIIGYVNVVGTGVLACLIAILCIWWAGSTLTYLQIGVDFALKVLNWDAKTIIRLQLWDIAGTYIHTYVRCVLHVCHNVLHFHLNFSLAFLCIQGIHKPHFTLWDWLSPSHSTWSSYHLFVSLTSCALLQFMHIPF